MKKAFYGQALVDDLVEMSFCFKLRESLEAAKLHLSTAGKPSQVPSNLV